MSQGNIDRRTFVKGMSAAGVGLALASGCATAQPKAASQPLAITPEVHAESAAQEIAPPAAGEMKDAKAS